MFTALREDGTMLNLLTIQDKDSLQLIRRSSFFCPECEGKLLLKMGDKKTPHFAHENRHLCTGSGESESTYHLEGKMDLFKKVQALGLKPELEPFYPEIKQRADVGFCYKNIHYVIEFQCAIISAKHFIKRTEGYKKLNITPIWILGFKNFKKWAPLKMKWSSFIFLFLNNYKEHFILTAYCPHQKRCYFHVNPHPITLSQSFLTSFQLPLSQLEKWQDSILAPNKWYITHWRESIHQQKNFHLHYLTKQNQLFLKEIYGLGLHPHFFPPFIGIPLRNGLLLETPPIFWQSYIFIDTFFSTKKNKIYPLQKIYEVFHARIIKGDIKLRLLPLLPSKDWKWAIKEYLQILITLSILEEVKEGFYRLIKKIDMVNNYKAQGEIEKKFYDQLKSINLKGETICNDIL